MKLATISIASLLLLAAGDLAQAQQEQAPMVGGRSNFQPRQRSLDLDAPAGGKQTTTEKKAKSKKGKKAKKTGD
jgi:hypothetical protein